MNDDQLRRLLNDAVSDVDPDDRLEELRASVRPKPRVVRHFHARPWYAAAGIVAAVICLVAFITSVAGDDHAEPGFAHGGSSGHSTIVATDTAAPTPSHSAEGDTRTYAVYYLGTDPANRTVLYREFHRGSAETPVGGLAVTGLTSSPLDPDYTTPWRPGDLLDAKANPKERVIFVTLGRGAVRQRPAGMSEESAKAALQQVVYTVQAAFRTRLPVDFWYHGKPATSVLGVPTPQPVGHAPVLRTLSLVNISSPNQGDQVSGRLTVTGVNNAFEGTSVIYLERAGHRYLVTPTIGGMGGNRMWPWTVTLDLSKVTPGSYTLVARNDDPSGHGHPPADTRVIEVK